jgi:hypothetical protein
LDHLRFNSLPIAAGNLGPQKKTFSLSPLIPDFAEGNLKDSKVRGDDYPALLTGWRQADLAKFFLLSACGASRCSIREAHLADGTEPRRPAGGVR